MANLRSAENSITEEMDLFQTSCHQLTSAINDLAGQVTFAEQAKKRVSASSDFNVLIIVQY